MNPIRVLVADDSTTVRKYIVETISRSENFVVVGEATDGKQATTLCQELKPSVVTLDMMMPGMNGLEATEYIMAYCPTPILIISSSTNRGEVFKTYDALTSGAVDILEKPLHDSDSKQWEEELLRTLEVVARIKVITHFRRRPRPAIEGVTEKSGVYPEIKAIAIGASTGGPAALKEILQRLPSDYPIPILLVIHISHLFNESFAEWLQKECKLTVTCAKDGQALPGLGLGGVILAPADRHLIVRGSRLVLTNDPEIHSCRPAVDVLFNSLAIALPGQVLGILLTGMGRDGAQGLLSMRTNGSPTIAQDESTSLIYGMPREAVQIGAAARILSLEKIGEELISYGDYYRKQGHPK